MLYLSVNGLTIAGLLEGTTMILASQTRRQVWWKWFGKNIVGKTPDGEEICWSALPEFAIWDLNGVKTDRPDSRFITLANKGFE